MHCTLECSSLFQYEAYRSLIIQAKRTNQKKKCIFIIKHSLCNTYLFFLSCHMFRCKQPILFSFSIQTWRTFIILDIDENDLLSPLLVIQTLSNNESTSLDLLKVNLFCTLTFDLIFCFLGLSYSKTS